MKLTAVSQAAVDAYDGAIDSYLLYRSDLPARIQAMLAVDPDCPMAYCLLAYTMLMACRADLLGPARAALAQARGCVATPRERAHQAALEAWIDGAPERAIAVWDQILLDHPHDILAFRMAHYVNFWCGRPGHMLASVLAVERHWSEALPGYGAILACRCFAQEEAGHYLEAEQAGREAVRLDPADLWAAHGVAHVLEMTGRRAEGIAWIEALHQYWRDGNNLKHHLWWHQALYYLERGDFPQVLRLYDTGFRDLQSPLTAAAPDLYIDVQNATSMLFRLCRLGVDTGDRWVELADKAQARIGDCQSAFTLPHWMMALAATGRDAAARDMLAAMRAFGDGASSLCRLVRDVALPVTQAVQANLQGRHADALASMRPVLGEMGRMGGSHAQQDVLEQVFLDSALKAGSAADARMLLERAAGRHRLPPARRIGYAMATGLGL